MCVFCTPWQQVSLRINEWETSQRADILDIYYIYHVLEGQMLRARISLGQPSNDWCVSDDQPLCDMHITADIQVEECAASQDILI